MSGIIEKTTNNIYLEPQKTVQPNAATKTDINTTENKPVTTSAIRESLNVTSINNGSSDGFFELEMDDIKPVTSVGTKDLDEILSISTKPKASKAELKNYLNSYIPLLLQASATDDTAQKTVLTGKAKELLKDYSSLKASNPEMVKELNDFEKQIFKTDAKGNILTGEINSVEKLVNYYGIKNETGLINSSHALLDKAKTIEVEIKNLKKNPGFENNLTIQKLEVEKALLFVQAKINLELANGAKHSDTSVTELTDVRTVLRRTFTRTELAGELNKLQHGKEPDTVIKNIERIGSNWYVKDDKEAFTQYRFALAQAKTMAGKDNEAIKLYESIKVSNPEQVSETQSAFLKGNAQIELAKVLYAEGNFAQADRIIGTVSSQNNNLKNIALFTQGNAYLQNNQPQKAFSSFDRILRESPSSSEAAVIRQTLLPFIVNNRLEAGKVDTRSDVWSAAQVALKASGSNGMFTSLGLAAGGAAAGAAIGAGIGVWIGGAGAVPGALIGLAVGTAADRISALSSEWNKVEQTYKTGYENISTFENTVNLIGLGLDIIDVIPVAGALGKVGSNAVKQSMKAGTKEVSSDILEEVMTKTGNTSVKNIESQMSSGMLKARELTRDIFENVDEMGKLFTDPKIVKTQVAVGGGLILTPGAIQSADAINEFRDGKIDKEELNKRLLNAGETTVKTAGSIILMGLVLGKVQNMGSKLDNMTKGMSKEMSGPAPVKAAGFKVESVTPEAVKGYIIQTIKDMAVQKNSIYSTDAKLGVLKEVAQAIDSGKIAVKENNDIVTFAKIRNDNGKVTFEINPKKFDPAFVDQTYIAHELIHIVQPMKDMPNNLREGFTEYTSRALFPRKDAPELDYDKLVKATDTLLEGLVKRGSEKGILGKFLGEQYKDVTPKDIETKPQLKEEIKLKIAQTLMEWSETKFKDRLSSWFGLDIEDLSKAFDNLARKK